MARTLAALALLLAIGAAGCDSDEPLEQEERNTDVTFTGAGGKVASYRVYQVFEDSEDPDGDGFADGDGNPDDIDGDGNPDFTSYCVDRGVAAATFGISSPWTFSVEIKVLRAGDIAGTVLVSSLVDPPDFSDDALRNLTGYDTAESTENAPLQDVVGFLIPAGCVDQPDFQCDLNGNECGSTQCRFEGKCSLDPDQICHDSVTTSAECPVGGAGTLCDCEAMTQSTGGTVVFGVCCTPELYDIVPGCAEFIPGIGNMDGRCTVRNEFGCVPSCAQLDKGSCEPYAVGKRFGFMPSPRVLSAVHRDLLRAGSNFIYDFDPDLAPTDDPVGGLCPGDDLGEPGIQGGGFPFSLQLNQGDTLVVTGRRFDDVPPGIEYLEFPSIRADLFVDGVSVSDVQGTTSTGTTSAGAINFTFTAR